MTFTAVPLGLEIMVSSVTVSLAARFFLSRQTPQTIGKWAFAAVVLGFASFSVLLVHHNASKLLTLWVLAGFAGCELIALWAGFRALSTRAGRWSLVACTWPLMMLAVTFLVHAVKMKTMP